MEEYYFGKCEQIYKRGERAMIIMDIKADNLYAFKNFHMNMSYPKKIVDSTIEQEYLADRPNFRYKKVNIIMGGNATGKTSLGKMLMLFANYFRDGGYKRFVNIITDKEKEAFLQVDFVTDVNKLYRFKMIIMPKTEEEYKEKDVEIVIWETEINKKDNYEICAKRLDEGECVSVSYQNINTRGWHFSYPQDAWKNKTYVTIEDDERYIYILENILKTLDPYIREVIKLKEVNNNTYVVKWDHCSAIIKDGQITDGEVLSSGTKAGLDVSYIIASLMCDKHDLYYCDELFSYINSDVERVCLSIMIEKLTDRKQLFFTTHNTDILDMQLPKHSYAFLKKDADDCEQPIKCIYAEKYLKRNTDSLKHAVVNDLFCTAPELHRLYEIADLY